MKLKRPKDFKIGNRVVCKIEGDFDEDHGYVHDCCPVDNIFHKKMKDEWIEKALNYLKSRKITHPKARSEKEE